MFREGGPSHFTVNGDKTQPGYHAGARAQANPGERSRKQAWACLTARVQLGLKASLCVLGFMLN